MKHTGICYNCKMKIPKGARICPYCHTESPDTEWSTMETIVFLIIVLGVVALFAAFLFLRAH